MRILTAAMLLAALGAAPVSADGTKSSAGDRVSSRSDLELPAAQPGVVVTIERGVRVWRPISTPVEEVAAAYPQTSVAAQPTIAAPYAGYSAGIYGGGFGNGYGNGYGSNGYGKGRNRPQSSQPLGVFKFDKRSADRGQPHLPRGQRPHEPAHPVIVYRPAPSVMPAVKPLVGHGMAPGRMAYLAKPVMQMRPAARPAPIMHARAAGKMAGRPMGGMGRAGGHGGHR